MSYGVYLYQPDMGQNINFDTVVALNQGMLSVKDAL